MPDLEPIDPSTDPLQRLAPTVDVDAATGTFGRLRARSKRRRLLKVGGALAVVLVGGVAVAAVARSGSDGTSEEIVSGPDPMTPAGPTTVTTEQEGLKLSLELPAEAAVGERLWATVTLTNDRPSAVSVTTVAGCGEPFRATGGSPGAIDSVLAATDPDAAGSVPSLADLPWSGDVATLPDHLESFDQHKVWVGREGAPGQGMGGCDGPGLSQQMAPAGGSMRRSIAIDLRWMSTESAEGQPFDVLVTTGGIVGGGDDLGRILVRGSLTLRDPIDRAASHAKALAADGIAAAPTFDKWLATTGDVDGVEQRYGISFDWWQGAWEAWIAPEFGGRPLIDPLRIRFDAASNAVSDVRTVRVGAAPSDDPDAYPTPPVEPVDEIRYQAG